MKLVAAKCPSCGANIDVDKDSDKTKCEFCHSTILVEDAIAKVKVEVTGNIEIKNLPKYENYVALADRYYNELMLREARTEYKKALELDPTNPKLIFREKICRACTMSFGKTDENIVDEAFKELQKTITDKKELSGYVKECSNAMAYIINKTTDYYRDNNLDYSGVVDVHYRISMCAINIWYFKNFVDEDDKETKLMLLEHYISAMHLLTQDMQYKVPHTRTKSTYKVSYKEKKKYVENMKQAEQERDALLRGDSDLESKSQLYIPKTNYFSGENAYTYFVILFILNIVVGLSFLFAYNAWGFLICLVNFIILVRRIKNAKNNSSLAKNVNIAGTIILVLAIMIGVINIKPTPEYANKWKNDNMIIIIDKEKAALKFEESETVISGKYTSECDENNTCKIKLGNYAFLYSNSTLCYLENEQCTQNLEISSEDISLPMINKYDICEDNDTITCNEKGYYVCGNGTEHPEYVCIYEEEKKQDDKTSLIVSAIFAFCLLSFIEWATKRRR